MITSRNIFNKLNHHHQWMILVVLFLMVLSPMRQALSINNLEKRAASMVPPSGSLIVRQAKTLPGEFSTIPEAIRSLRGTKGPKTIFIFPGVYTLGVYINYGYPLTIQGYTSNGDSYSGNQVTVRVATGRSQSGGDAQSSAIWVQQNDFKMFNINVVNTYGTGTDTQAVALTSQGERHVYAMCSFSSYQDTLYVKSTSAYFLGCNIEGAVDFIFGGGNAWFERANIVVKAPKAFATITAHKGTGGSKFVFNRSNIVGDKEAKTGSSYLGRPWSSTAAATFQFCTLSSVINPAGWIAWNPPSDPRTQSVQLYEYQNQGLGSQGTRSIGKIVSQPLSVAQVLGALFNLDKLKREALINMISPHGQ